MQKFEYRVIEYVQKEKQGMGIRVTASSAHYPRYENADEIPDWESLPPFHEHLITLGEQGWQYAGNAPALQGGFSCVFLRST
jgi:hypothetical protein